MVVTFNFEPQALARIAVSSASNQAGTTPRTLRQFVYPEPWNRCCVRSPCTGSYPSLSHHGQAFPWPDTTVRPVLLLIISEAIQNGMVRQRRLVTNAIVLVTTLVIVDIGLSLRSAAPRGSKRSRRHAVVVVERGRPRRTGCGRRVWTRRRAERRAPRGTRSGLAQVKYAVLERKERFRSSHGTIRERSGAGATSR